MMLLREKKLILIEAQFLISMGKKFRNLGAQTENVVSIIIQIRERSNHSFRGVSFI